ncbi:MAG: hypothetical protein ACM36C_05000 [Acidobacteriota bacterium]
MNAQLPGELAYVFLVSILDAVLLSWVALTWYRRSVSRLMRLADDPGPAAPVITQAAPRPVALSPRPLTFALYDAGNGQGVASARPPGNRTQVVLAYTVAAALYSAVITTAQLGTQELPFAAWFGTWCIHLWPLVPTLAVILVLDRRATARLAVQYVAGVAGAVALVTFVLQIFRGSFNSTPLTNAYWVIAGMAVTAWAPLVVLLLMGWRRTRAVLPLALAATLVFGFGSLAFRDVMIRAFNLPAFRSGFLALAALTGTQFVYYGLFMIVSLPVGWIAWRLLRWLAGAFERKRFSDVQLLIDCWWMVVAADMVATTLVLEYGLAGVGIGIAAFVVYRAAVAVVLRARPAESSAPQHLLLLRVFGYEARTESLFDRVAQLWRFTGPVQLIAGVDLATRTVDPGDVLMFLNGRLAAKFVARESEVPQQLQRLDSARDPDGRHRVNELYCHDNTWRTALQSLLDVSDTGLMDLRSFTAQNAGCVFELQQLVRRVPTERIVLTCDDSTDLALLGKILSDAWSTAVADGTARGSGEIAIVRLRTGRHRELAVLMKRLMGVTKAQRLFQANELPVAWA